MNLTLGTLAELKAHLLNASLTSATTYDAAIAALGKGVAGRFEQACNRKFARSVADTFVTNADRTQLVLPRFPLESISKVEVRDDVATGWVDQGTVSGVVFNQREASGLVEFGGYLGTRLSRLRVTYTGGYWLDESADGSLNRTRSYQQGTATLTANAESKAITFTDEFVEAPNVDVRVIPPAGGLIIEARASSITTAGFTALIGFPIPSTDYSLQWEASTSVSDAVPGAQPEGSTAVPDDLKFAWLLQCEHLWKLRDKLGLSLGGGDTGGTQLLGLTLAGANLIPDVKATLDQYVRYAID